MDNDEIAKLDLSGWPLPEECLTEIGRVAALWACLESFLNICLGKLAGFNDLDDPKPFILLTHASFPQRVDMLGALCEHLATEHSQLSDYKTVVSRLRAAQAVRNQYMHHGLSYDRETRQLKMATISARGKLKTAVQTISLEDIKRAAIEIDAASRALYKLVLRRDVPPPWKK